LLRKDHIAPVQIFTATSVSDHLLSANTARHRMALTARQISISGITPTALQGRRR
jgi:hypothetical protein